MTDLTARTPPRRALVVSQLPPPVHGSTVMTQRLLETLAELGWEPRLVDRRFSSAVDQVGRASVWKVLRVPGIWARLLVELIRFRPDVCIFFITNRRGSFLVDAGMAAILRLFPRVRVIHYPHTMGYAALAESGRPWRFLVRFLLGAADAIVTLGPSLTADVAGLAPKARCTSIANFVDPPEVQPNPDAPPTLLFLSNLLPEKGAADFIEMAALVRQTHPEVRFVVAGPATDESYAVELHQRTVELGIESKVEFLGQVGDRKWQLLADASALVFPSTFQFEAQPLTILEAMSVGTPVVAYDTGGIRDIFPDDQCGHLVARHDVESATAAVLQLLESPRLLQMRSLACRTAWRSSFDRQTFAHRWAQILGDRFAT